MIPIVGEAEALAKDEAVERTFDGPFNSQDEAKAPPDAQKEAVKAPNSHNRDSEITVPAKSPLSHQHFGYHRGTRRLFFAFGIIAGVTALLALHHFDVISLSALPALPSTESWPEIPRYINASEALSHLVNQISESFGSFKSNEDRPGL